jgi:hypothetical protein
MGSDQAFVVTCLDAGNKELISQVLVSLESYIYKCTIKMALLVHVGIFKTL